MRFFDKKEIDNLTVEGSYAFFGKLPEGISRMTSNLKDDDENQFIYEG